MSNETVGGATNVDGSTIVVNILEDNRNELEDEDVDRNISRMEPEPKYNNISSDHSDDHKNSALSLVISETLKQEPILQDIKPKKELLEAKNTPPLNIPSPSVKPRTPGILRLEKNSKKSRRLSGVSSTVEFRKDPEMLGKYTPTSSNPISPQLSVTWAFQEENRGLGKHHAETSTQNSPPIPNPSVEKDKSPKFTSTLREVFCTEPRAKLNREDSRCASPRNRRNLPAPLSFMETFKTNSLDAGGTVDSEDEDYSQSVSAIMQRRASTRGRSRHSKSPRRSSSPLVAIVANHKAHHNNYSHANMNNNIALSGVAGAHGADRRRSSAYTTSSDTAISFEDDNNQGSSKEQIVENIRLHKEVLQSVKYQSWSIRRKLRLVRQAKSYVAKHEGALQERFAQSRATGALWARFKLLITAKMQHIHRELTNFSTQLIPWESRIKEIESHFGSVVASYFTFLRWLLWVNIVIALVFALFVVVPEVVSSDLAEGPGYKRLLKGEIESAGYLGTAIAFEGYLKYSALFYGYYSNVSEAVLGYKLPLAYFLTGLAIYIYSFIATLRKMAKNSRMSKLSSKDDECIFSWKLFTGWDFLIGHAETAHNRIASVVLSFKEALLEEAEKKKNKGWKIICIRIIVNIIVLALLCASAYAVIVVVDRSTHPVIRGAWLRENEITICITFISHVFPIMFDILGCFESYHPRKQLRLQLARIMFLNLLTLYALIFAQFMKIDSMNKQSEKFRLFLSTAEVVNGSIPMTESTTPLPYESFSNKYLFAYGDTDDQGHFSTVKSVVKNYDRPLALLDGRGREFNLQNVIKTKEVTENDDNDWMKAATTSCVQVVVKCGQSVSTVHSGAPSEFPPAANFTVPTVSTLLTIATMMAALNSMVSLVKNETTAFGYINATDMTYEGDMPNNYNSTAEPSNDYNFATTEDVGDYFEEGFEVEESNFVSSDFTRKINRFRRFLEGLDNSNQSLADSAAVELSLNETNLDLLWGNITLLLANSTLSSNDSLDNYTDILRHAIQFVNRSTELSTFDEIASEEDSSTTEEVVCYEYICPNQTYFTNKTDEEEEYNQETIVPEDEFQVGQTEATPYIEIRTEMNNLATSSQDYGIYEISTQGITSTPVLAHGSTSTVPPSPTRPPKPKINITDIDELQRRSKYLAPVLQQRIRNLCWETMFGREILKLNVMDIFLFCLSVFCMDFLRALFVRFMNKCWCWDLEKKFPRYNDFKIAENILHLINNQGMVWMGMFFSPGLAIINMVKLIIILYLRSWAVLTCNVPHSVVFRASRSNNFYLGLLLIMLFLCVLPVSYMIVWIEPSWHCGPFYKQKRISVILTDTIRTLLPKNFHFALDRIASSSTVIPMLVLLILIIYYLISLTSALREANQDLRNQLRRERMEERRKMLKLNEQKQNLQENVPISLRWRKVLDSASSPLTPTTAAGAVINPEEAQKIQKKKERLQRIMKKALRKGSATSDEESVGQRHNGEDENTDTEQHESLPHDQEVQDNKINSQKQSGGEKKRDLFPELIKKLRESAKRNNQIPENPACIDVPPQGEPPAIESTDDDERVVRERRRSLLRRAVKDIREPEAVKFDVIDETCAGAAVEKHPKSKVKASVFTFDVPKTFNKEKGEVSPKSPIYATVNKTRITSADPNEETIKGKFNSFFTIVKEAVRRQSIAEQQHIESINSAATRSPNATPPVSKRDSDCSIWSDNIPVITISKTESDECILEEDKKSLLSAPATDNEKKPPKNHE